jgi:hypothetical protein
LLTLALGAPAASCALLANLNLPVGTLGNVTPPRVTFTGATLARAPAQVLLAAYYCPEVVSVPFGGAQLLCAGFFGSRPPASAMTVAFDLHFTIENPNNIPIPLASILTAATVFPAATNQRLGAACVQLCAPGQACSGQAPPGACQASSRDVRSLDDFASAAANMLISAGVAAATGQPLTFTAPQVSAASRIDVVVRFSFGPDQLLATLRQLAIQSASELKMGRQISFNIPYRIEGTVFFDAGSFGRIAVGYGPLAGSWVLPVQGLIPR